MTSALTHSVGSSVHLTTPIFSSLSSLFISFSLRVNGTRRAAYTDGTQTITLTRQPSGPQDPLALTQSSLALICCTFFCKLFYKLTNIYTLIELKTNLCCY